MSDVGQCERSIDVNACGQFFCNIPVAQLGTVGTTFDECEVGFPDGYACRLTADWESLYGESIDKKRIPKLKATCLDRDNYPHTVFQY